MKFSKLALTIAILSLAAGSMQSARAQTEETPTVVPSEGPAAEQGLTPEAAVAAAATAAKQAANAPAKKAKKKKKTAPIDLNTQSSSFVPDPDPLDPLPPNSENLKDEDDIVVDDIKEVLNKPIPPPVLETPQPSVKPSTEEVHPSKIDEFAGESENRDSYEDNAGKNGGDKKNILTKPRQKNKKTARKGKIYNNNEPDLELEKRFYRVYKSHNSEPTSTQAWDAVSAPRAAQVYKIQKGDNLYNISGILFGDSQFWPKIWSLNELDIMNPHFIYPNRPIYFYPGTVDMPPTLSLEKTQNTILPSAIIPSLPVEKPADLKTPSLPTPMAHSDVPTKEGELFEDNTGEDAIDKSRKAVLSEEKAIDGRTYDRQNTEWKKNIIVRSKKDDDESTSGDIPQSLPNYFSGKYFEPRKADFTWDIKKAEIKPIEIPPNPYIVTRSQISTDYKISSSDIVQCKDQYFVPKVEKVNPQAQPGRYFVLDQLKLMSSTFKTTQIYRWIATADIAADSSLRMVKCRQLVNTDVILVSQDKINELLEPTESGSANMEVLEGLDFTNQSFVAANQFVLLSAGSDLIVPDQTYKIYSKQAGVNVGRVHVVKKKGPLAIGYVIEATDVINLNDTIVVE